MRPLFLLVLFFTSALTAIAQRPRLEIKTSMPKNSVPLQNVDVRMSLLPPDSTITPGLYNLPQDNMPCVVPDTRTIAAMPNALPELKIPDVAALSNPARTKDMDNLKRFRHPGPK